MSAIASLQVVVLGSACLAESERRRAEFSLERTVERRQIGKAGIECHVENGRPRCEQPQRGSAQSRPSDILVRCLAHDFSERAKEVKRTEPRESGELLE